MRHFPTSWNQARRLQGQTDISLTDAARHALEGLAIPAPWNQARLVASTLMRADETARILARGRAVESDTRLVEVDYGAWEGRRGADLLADPSSGYSHVENWGWHHRPPKGESPWDAWQRVRPALAEIAVAGAPALLIVHRALMRVVLARAWGWDFDRPEPFKIRRGRIYPMTLARDGAPSDPGEPVRLVPFP